MTKSTIDEDTGLFSDVSLSEIPSNNGNSTVQNVGFELYHAPTHLKQSPIFDGSYSGIQSFAILDYREKILYWHGVSLLFWIKIENIDLTEELPIMVIYHFVWGFDYDYMILYCKIRI